MTLRERWVRWRNARLADPRFQLRAAKLPLIATIARRESAGLFDTVAGFVYSQILAACVELDLFETIGTGSIDAGELAKRTGLEPERAKRLLLAAATLDLTENVGGDRFALGRQGAALLGNPGIAAMVAHHRLLYGDLADPVGLLRRGRGQLANYWRYAADGDAATASAYSSLMAASQAMVAAQLLTAYDFSRHRHLLDVGGGEGVFVEAVQRKHPELAYSLFDLPAVVVRAKARIGGFAAIHAGSFFDHPLPRGAGLITLIRVLHDHDDGAAMLLLRAVADALGPGDTLLIGEPMAGVAGAERMGNGYFGMYLLAMGTGRPRTPAEIGAMLIKAGFCAWRFRPTGLPIVTSLIEAKR